MITKKICLVGNFGVGKTSLVARYVNHTFSDSYLTTVGVSIKTKLMTLSSGEEMKLIIWDIAGEDNFSSAMARYLKGANGLLSVADGTRKDSLGANQNLVLQSREVIGEISRVSVINKSDLVDDWSLDFARPPEHINTEVEGHILTSAKTGENVEFAFSRLAEKMCKP